MGVADGMEVAIGALNLAVDPGRGPIRRGLRAERQQVGEGAIGGDAERITADGLGKRPGQMEAVERQDGALLGFDPIDFGGIAVVRHGKDADRIGLEQYRGIDHHCPSYGAYSAPGESALGGAGDF